MKRLLVLTVALLSVMVLGGELITASAQQSPRPHAYDVYYQSNHMDYTAESFTVPVGFTRMRYQLNAHQGAINVLIDGSLFLDIEGEWAEATVPVRGGEEIAFELFEYNQMDGLTSASFYFDGWYEPTAFSAVNTHPQGTTLKWTPAFHAPDFYVLYWKQSSASTWNVINLPGTASSFEFTAITQGVYNFELRALKGGYYSSALTLRETIATPLPPTHTFTLSSEGFFGDGNWTSTINCPDFICRGEFSAPAGFSKADFEIYGSMGGCEYPWGYIYQNGELVAGLDYQNYNDYEGSLTVSPGDLFIMETRADIGCMAYVYLSITFR